LEAALTASRRADLRHGTTAAYVHGCVCSEWALQVFKKWSPAEGNNFLQFLDRIDGRGGFAVVETEDPTLIARDTAIFGAFLDFSVYPVLDSEEWAGIAVEAVEFRRSAS
jgi:hypothetical protein